MSTISTIAILVAAILAAVAAGIVFHLRRRIAELEASEEMLRLTLEGAHIGTWMWEVGSDELQVSNNIDAILGFAPGVFALTVEDLRSQIHPDDREVQDRAFREALHEGRDYEVEHRIIGTGGAVQWVEGRGRFHRDASGRAVHFAGTFVDVTERKVMEEALRASERSFMTAFHGSPNMIVINSYPEGRILEVNEATCKVGGYRREELIGRTTVELDLWGSLEDRARMLEELQAHGKIRDMEFSFRTRSGEVRPALLNTAIIEWNGQRCLLSTAQDITDIKRAQRELEAKNAELETKNAELERFAYTVSHDLKSPLVTIRGFLGLVEKDAAQGDLERLHHDVGRIREASAIMGRLLDELLELSRIGHAMNPPEDVDLAGLVRQAVDLVGGQVAERGVRVEVAPDLPVVRGDRPRLLEVYQNLIDNAVKFLGEEADPRIEVGWRRDGGERVFFVRDNGIGIEPRYHGKVFELFERLDLGIDGTGVGLALVKRIVEVHGGRVWVESAGIGRGSAFCFTLPEVVLA